MPRSLQTGLPLNSTLIALISILLMATSRQAPGQAIRETSIDTTVFHRAWPGIFKTSGQTGVSLDTSIDNSGYLPPVGAQGLNDCSAWAVGYYYKTWKETRKRGWDNTSDAHRFSPSFLYNQANGGLNSGSAISLVFKILLWQGCATLKTFPVTNDYNTWPTESAYLEAMNYRAEQLFYLPQQYDDTGINALRQLLLSGEICVFAFEPRANFQALSPTDPDYCVATLSNDRLGDHSVTIVGFDDKRQTPDGPGAFRVVNSWGTSWGDNGFFWFSYQLFKTSKAYHSPLYFARDDSVYTPQFVVKVRLSHQSSMNVSVSVLLGSTLPPITRDWNRGVIYFSPIRTLRPFPDFDIPIDASEFVAHMGDDPMTITVKAEDSYKDSLNGSINGAGAYWLNGRPGIQSKEPMEIPDVGTALYPIAGVTNPVPDAPIEQASSLFQNYPDPFNPITTIRYVLAASSQVRISVFDMLGHELSVLVDERRNAGTHEVKFDASGLPSGVYFYRIHAGNLVSTRKALYLK